MAGKSGLAEVTAVMRSNHDDAVKDGIDIDSFQWGQIKAWRPTAITKTVPNISDSNVAPFDYILVTTKNIPDVSPTVEEIIASAVTPGKTDIVLSQNGINIEKPLIARFPTNPIISSKIGAYNSPEIPAGEAEEAAKRYVNIYNPEGKLNVIYEPDVAKVRWRKVAYNGSMNPVASILRMDTPRMRMSQHIIDDLVLPIMLEIRAIVEASGVILQADLVDAVMHQDPNDTAFKPSMCQDYEKGNPMEIENLIGEPLREAQRLNVPAPTLKLIYAIMKGLRLKVKERKGLWVPRFEPGNPYE
ncbi:ketopantoate reductase PanE/ApbA C terminal-domain-containing protein [Penicillium longicatenatum]|uniref:ketopantoate reductase PanE/ApbA C terminal-domain-containing protein n=1 Tax=Penicillium longicatenatum TaxID=1561947 RepID=UPI002546DD83|nr:ketopantoate reductase PanE/ApbA C terminal-domain-containing protein [Penicillium longicatenatum]KAJ5657874.1 ketopantoate reductase PanE/ApbA C terminal-domain-containing protein [Penicillium longicatenatum]